MWTLDSRELQSRWRSICSLIERVQMVAGVMGGKCAAESPRSAALLGKRKTRWSRCPVVGRGDSKAAVVFLGWPPWWEAMFGGKGGDARPSKREELCGRMDRVQSDVVLRNVGGGERSGSVSYYCNLFFFFNLDCELFLSGQMHTCAHPTVLGTTAFQLSMGHIVQNLQLQSIPPSPS